MSKVCETEDARRIGTNNALAVSLMVDYDKATA